ISGVPYSRSYETRGGTFRHRQVFGVLRVAQESTTSLRLRYSVVLRLHMLSRETESRWAGLGQLRCQTMHQLLWISRPHRSLANHAFNRTFRDASYLAIV